MFGRIILWLVAVGLVGLFYNAVSEEPAAQTQDSTSSFVSDVETYYPTPTPSAKQNCHPSYSGCLNPDASDYDCAGGSGNGPYYTGPVQVYGYDEYGLDRDGDGWGCE